MVTMPDGAIGQAVRLAQLPPFARVEDILADALPVLDPPSRITVTEAAERYLRVQVQGAWQAFDRSVTPYMVEPSDVTQSRKYKGVAFVGPSQSGKTLMLQTVCYHAITCDQRPVLIVHMTRGDRNKWVEEKLNPGIQNSPEIRARLGRGRNDDTFERKRFQGMNLSIGYPTPTILSGATYATVLLTDLDHMPLVLGGADNPEGSPFRMAMQRVKTYMSRGMVLAESSPAWPVTDPSWTVRSNAPHEMPPVEGGICALYNLGTRARWYWECPDCGDEFEPRVDRLVFDDGLDPAAAGDAAEMGCPHCGSLIGHRHKMELNRAAAAGRGGWRHEAEGGGLAALGDDAIRKSDVASYALNGAAATFATWRDIVMNLQAARERAAQLDDDADLAAVHYTEIGVPYHRRTGDDAEIGQQFLRDHAQPAERGVAPSWTKFITITVDVQSTFFPVQITAWDADGTAQIVDRFDLTQPPADAPNAEPDDDGNRRRLDPGRYPEDWKVLEALAERVIPVAGAEYGLMPVFVGVDFQGAPGVSDNSEAFWKGRRKAGVGSRWILTRGRGGFHVPFRTVYEQPDRAAKGQKARGIKLLTIATDRLKDTVFAALGRAAGGAGAIYMSEWVDEDLAAEFVAEERTGKGWVKKRGVIRNEGLDLTVMARALAEHKGLLKIKPDYPPSWAEAGPGNVNAVQGTGKDRGGPTPGRPKPKKRISRRAGRLF